MDFKGPMSIMELYCEMNKKTLKCTFGWGGGVTLSSYLHTYTELQHFIGHMVCIGHRLRLSKAGESL